MKKIVATITDSFGKVKTIENPSPVARIGDYLYTCANASCGAQVFLGDTCKCGHGFPGVYEIEKARGTLSAGKWYFTLEYAGGRKDGDVSLVLVDHKGQKHGCGNILRMGKGKVTYRHAGLTEDTQIALTPGDKRMVVD